MVGTAAPAANVLSGTVVTFTLPRTAEESLKPEMATPATRTVVFHGLALPLVDRLYSKHMFDASAEG